MKILFISICCFLFVSTASSQAASWTIQLNNKTLLTATTEDTATNQVVVNDLKKGSLFIRYKETPSKDFGRSITVYSSNDVELYKKRERTLVIPVSLLKQWAKKEKHVKVYTMLVPLNPATAAVIRLRRIHLCTINFN